jgi:hypothetical protein
MVDDAQRHSRHGAPGGGRDHPDRVAGPRHRDDGTLHQPIRVDHAFEADPVEQAPDELGRHRGGPADGHSQRGHVTAAELLEDPVEERRRAGQDADPVPLDHVHQGIRGEHRDRHHRDAFQHAGDQAGVQPEAVRERRDDRIAVILVQRHDGRPVPVAAQQLGMVEHHALRRTRRPRGRHDLGEIVRVHRQCAFLIVGHAVAAGQEGPVRQGRVRRSRCPAGRPTGLAGQQDRAAQAGQVAERAPVRHAAAGLL